MTEYLPDGPNFPILDADRAYANREFDRHIIAECGYAEPYVAEMDSWVTMPVRVVVDTASGVHIELGPYSLDEADVRKLQDVIRIYHETTGRSRLHVIDGEQ